MKVFRDIEINGLITRGFFDVNDPRLVDSTGDRTMNPNAESSKRIACFCVTHQGIYIESEGCPACARNEPKVTPLADMFSPLFGKLKPRSKLTWHPDHAKEIHEERIRDAIRLLVDSGYEVSRDLTPQPEYHGILRNADGGSAWPKKK